MGSKSSKKAVRPVSTHKEVVHSNSKSSEETTTHLEDRFSDSLSRPIRLTSRQSSTVRSRQSGVLRPGNETQPKAQGINIRKAARVHPRVYFPDLRENKGQKHEKTGEETSPRAVILLPVTEPNSTKSRHVRQVPFAGTTQLLLKRHLAQEKTGLKRIEFEEVPTPEVIYDKHTGKKTTGEKVMNTYKLIKPKKIVETSEKVVSVQDPNMISLLREAAVVKYAMQRKSYASNHHSVFDLKSALSPGGQPERSSPFASPFLQSNFESAATAHLESAKYKIKSLLALKKKDSGAREGLESSGIKSRAGQTWLWKGRRGSILVTKNV